ncbi:MAG: prolyl-tRNA synthetase associated domain-containing protein [Fimbriimonadaceae bacterium]|nr:prolyl-tRNA synthetase associated domain-containing protein [Alphaproteobacteria bacterium]
MPATRDDLFARLQTLEIKTETVEHPALFTVEDSKQLRGEIPGGHSKNLFLKDKKGVLWLVVALEDAKIEMNRLHKIIGSARLSFGNGDLLTAVLGVPAGSVTPFALINDTENRVNVVLDHDMMAHDILNYHPLTNTATTRISNQDLLKFIQSCGHQPNIIKVSVPDTSENAVS